MVATLVHIKPEQKRRLVRKARRRGTSVSQEMRNALDFYLELPEDHNELAELAAAARRATERMIERLDETLVVTNRTLRRWGKR
jgi:hypothetical protein